MSGASFQAMGAVNVIMQLGEITSITEHGTGPGRYVRLCWRAYGDRGEPAQLDLDIVNAVTTYRELARILAGLAVLQTDRLT